MDVSDVAKIGLLAGVVGAFLVAVLEMDTGHSSSAEAPPSAETASS
jgi:uncharacterized membrane protein